MAKFNMYYYNYICIIVALLIGNVTIVLSQGNCLLYSEGSGERKACELSYKAIEYRQGSKESQLLFDQAIKVGPKYAYAYYQKSVPFFKRGLLADGLSLINKAIELEPQNYLFYRAYYYFYNRSYDLCIRDLEELYTLHKASFVTTPGGELEMRSLLAMSYASTGAYESGIDWMLHLMNKCKEQPQLKGQFDHFCLGALYYKNNQLDLAQSELTKQLSVDSDFADTYYYLGLINEDKFNHKLANEFYKKSLDKIKRKDGGYSTTLLLDLNITTEIIESKLNE